jgi:GT2 family glycosyltransferase
MLVPVRKVVVYLSGGWYTEIQYSGGDATIAGASAMVYIILVNWNGCDDTIECLESLLRLFNQKFRVIICDNGSDDSSIEQIVNWSRAAVPPLFDGPPWIDIVRCPRRREPTVQVIAPEAGLGSTAPVVTIVDVRENLGFAGACNVGIRLARGDPDAEFVWLLNNDTVVDPRALDALLAHMSSDPALGILGSCLLYYDRPDTVQSLGGWYRHWIAKAGQIGMGLTRNENYVLVEIEAKLSYVAGASMFVPLRVIDDIGEMSEDYFLYYEELDWAMRLNGKYRQSVCLESNVYHKQGASIGINLPTRPGNTSLYYINVNSLRFTAKYTPLVLPCVFGRVVLKLCVYYVERDRDAVLIMYMVLRDFICHRRRRGLVQIR